MADVVVVGAGVGGMAAAARLAKLGHRVTVLERLPAAGGRLRRIESAGFAWDAGPASTGLPAVLRDLFRKSGRPIERYLPLELRTPARRHVFGDGAIVDLPTGSRAAQLQAVDAGLGAGAGASWSRFVDAQADVWNQWRLSPDGPDGGAGYFGEVGGGADGGAGSGAGAGADGGRGVRAAVTRRLQGSSDRLLRRSLADERLRGLVSYRFELDGSDARSVPAFVVANAYVERSFGVWTSPDGLSPVSDALVTRLTERKVEVRYGCAVTRITHESGWVTGVALADGSVTRSDLVVAAIDPLVVFTDLLGDVGARWARVFRSAARVEPPGVLHVGLRDDGPVSGVAGEVVFHSDPVVVVEADGQAPAGHRAWTIRTRGAAVGDVLSLLADRGLDVRDQVVVRLDRSPSRLLAETGEAAYPIVWDGLRAHRRRTAAARPLPGLFVLAAPLPPGSSVPEVAWTAANLATAIGKP